MLVDECRAMKFLLIVMDYERMVSWWPNTSGFSHESSVIRGSQWKAGQTRRCFKIDRFGLGPVRFWSELRCDGLVPSQFDGGKLHTFDLFASCFATCTWRTRKLMAPDSSYAFIEQRASYSCARLFLEDQCHFEAHQTKLAFSWRLRPRWSHR